MNSTCCMYQRSKILTKLRAALDGISIPKTLPLFWRIWRCLPAHLYSLVKLGLLHRDFFCVFLMNQSKAHFCCELCQRVSKLCYDRMIQINFSSNQNKPFVNFQTLDHASCSISLCQKSGHSQERWHGTLHMLVCKTKKEKRKNKQQKKSYKGFGKNPRCELKRMS